MALQEKYRSQGLRVIGISLDDNSQPVSDFYQQFKLNYPVAIGNAKLTERYGGILGLPVNFLIGRDGRIYCKHAGEADVFLIEWEIKSLLRNNRVFTANTKRRSTERVSEQRHRICSVPPYRYSRDSDDGWSL